MKSPNNRTIRTVLFLAGLVLLIAIALSVNHISRAKSPAISRPSSATGNPSISATASLFTNNSSMLRIPDQPTKDRVQDAYRRATIGFEANDGQFDARVKFFARGEGYSCLLTGNEAVLLLNKEKSDDSKRSKAGKHSSRKTATSVVKLKFIKGMPNLQPTGQDLLASRTNKYVGPEDKWRVNVATYGKIKYPGVYPGVDVIYYGTQTGLKYDLAIAPNADPGNILFQFEGAKGLKIASNGDLVFQTAAGEVRQPKPYVYQQDGEIRRKILASYVIKKKQQVGFELGAYDTSKTLTIDPEISFSTNLGGQGNDFARGIALDSDGNVYVVGGTNSQNFPATANAYRNTLNDTLQHTCFDFTVPYCYDVFVTKMDPTLSSVLYSTYIGGSLNDVGDDVAVDASGNVYVTGDTISSDFPTLNPLEPVNTVFYAGFVLKLNAQGDLVYSTYFAESFSGLRLGVDPEGRAVVADSRGEVVSVTKLNASGNGTVFSTVLANSGTTLRDITVDSDGNAYAVGFTYDPDFHTVNPLQSCIGDDTRNGFVAKLDGNGSFIYSTCLVGEGISANGVAADSSGNAYVTGAVGDGFVTTPSAFQPNFAGGAGRDAFVTKINPTGTAILYSTYIGGSTQEFPYPEYPAEDSGRAIAVDQSGNAYVTGDTLSHDFPITPDARWPGGGGIFFKLDTNASGAASLIYSTHNFGGVGSTIAVDEANGAYIAGGTSYALYFTSQNAFQPYHGAYGDAFITKYETGGICQRPVHQTPLAELVVSQTDWSMDVGVSDTDGLVLTNVMLGDRYMAKTMSVPYYVLETSAFSKIRAELKPNGDAPYARSRLVDYSISDGADKLVIEAAYVIDKIPAGSESCLEITQRYEFYKATTGCEPSETMPCAAFKPLVTYKFHGAPNETLTSLNVVQRHHFWVDGNPANSAGVFHDCDTAPNGCLPVGFLFDYKKNPVTNEEYIPVIANGQDLHQIDNYHQTWMENVDEPGPNFNHPNPFSPGCPECVHMHWRWGANNGSEFGGGNLLIPPGTNQDVSIAVVRFHNGEEHPDDFLNLWSNLEPLRISESVPADIVFYYSATGYQNEDLFFGHGGFFNPAYKNVQASSGNVDVTYGNFYEDGELTATPLDPSSAGTLPNGYVAYNNLAYEVATEAEVSGPHMVTFHLQTPTSAALLATLKVFHGEKGSLIDRTTASNFDQQTITAQVNSLSPFVIAMPATAASQLTALGPAQVWVGLKNSDDVGTKFDLLAEVFRNGTLIGSGQVNSVAGGSSGFNNAKLNAINLALSQLVGLGTGDTLSLKLSMRIAATGHRSGTARLWFNDAAANSRFAATIGGTSTPYFLRSSFALGSTAGSGPKNTIDVFADRAVGGNPFKPFGTWTKTF